MAKRRQWSTGRRIMSGLGQGGMAASEAWMRNVLADKADERAVARQSLANSNMLDRQGELQRRSQQFTSRQDALNDLPNLLEKIGPEAAFARLAQNQPPSTFEDAYQGTGEPQMEQLGNLQRDAELVDSYQMPLRRVLSPIAKRIDEATDPTQIPPAPSIEQDASGLDSRTYTPHIQIGPGDQQGEVMGLAPEVQDLIDRASGKSQALRDKPTNMVTITNPDGSKTTRKMSDMSLAEGVQTEPSAGVSGTNAGIAETAKEKVGLQDPMLTALKGQAAGRIAALTEALSRDAKVKTAVDMQSAMTPGAIDRAARIAGATKRAELAPDIIKSEAERATAMNQEKTAPSERAAAAQFPEMLNAHAMATQSEANGARIDFMSQYATGDHWIAPLLNPWVDDQTRSYLQAARDFISTYGQIRSGATVREDEYDRFISYLFATPGDSPQQIKAKQQSREVFIAATQAMVGKATPQAAQVLGNAVNRGQIPLGVLSTIDFSPEMAQALAASLSPEMARQLAKGQQ